MTEKENEQLQIIADSTELKVKTTEESGKKNIAKYVFIQPNVVHNLPIGNSKIFYMK
ncbi:hypothetical protein [uncultured Aquimarina sp.]|uniref:hypothetical protein n=1 Tax=uncultured Aquimarina sp. TaxID=575652 RepID=UPI00261BFD09|nr:hypothetical protein [uncultured Aquimarina sp.]